jgi:prepilin peptidase CpaA
MYTDWRWLRIPNVVTYPTIVVGLGLAVLEGFPGTLFLSGFVDHLAGVVLAFAFSWPFYAAGGLKAGDAKLLMAIGAVRGTSFLLGAALYGALLGGIIAVGFIVSRRLRAAPGGANTMGAVMKSSMPYGIALGLGGLIALAVEALAVTRVAG